VARYALRRLVLRSIIRRAMPGAPIGEDDGARTFGAGGVTVTERGAGPAILLVHAGSSTGATWTGVARLLADRFRVLTYDRPTYRTKPPLRSAEAMAAEVSDLLTVAGTVGGPLLVVGHSSGAVVALEATLVAPSRCAGLLLY
jgi:pimeloyl-ACP methyl ester carboxylesterase